MDSQPLQLYTSLLSHFARKVRLLMEHLNVPFEVVDVGNVAEGDAAKFAGNPIRKVPVLVDGDQWLIESDHIAQYLVRKFDPWDRFEVLTEDPWNLNCRAMINGIMSEEVKLILPARMGVQTEGPYFDRTRLNIREGLVWLESQASRFTPLAPKYREFHLLCAWEHLAYYDMIPASGLPLMRSICGTLADGPLCRRSSPFVLKPK